MNFKSIKELQAYVLKQTLKAQDEFLRRADKELPPVIISQIEKGISPVDGEGRFVEYSDAYKKQIKDKSLPVPKKQRPVNLKLTGKLLKSIKSTVSSNILTITFTNFLAEIHSILGAGKSKTIRKMLPFEKGDDFNPAINRVLKKILKESTEKHLK